MKKYLSFILALLLLISTAACGNAPATQTSEPSASPATEPAAPSEPSAPTEPRERITLTIGMPDNSKITSFEENALTQWVEAQCDVELKFHIYKATGDMSREGMEKALFRTEADILYGTSLWGSSITKYGKEGQLLDLTSYFEDREGASKIFWDRMAQCLTPQQQAYVMAKITDGDTGRIYGVPSIRTGTAGDRLYQPWINQTWLDQLGLEMPQSTEELYAVLKAFWEQKPGGESTIPLFGSEKAGRGASAVDWIINMFIYYNPDHLWQDYNGDGQLESVYTQEAYREALRFINQLYREHLLSNMIYVASSSDMQAITTPEPERVMCGIFCGNLTYHTTENSEALYEYTPMPLWGYGVEEDFDCSLRNFITKDCPDPDRAFEVLMALWSWEGTMRVRYGEYGVNWTDADPGTVSDMGYPAEYKLLSDPLEEPNCAHWGTVSCGLLANEDGETAQMAQDISAWQAYKGQLNADSRALFEEAQSHNPENLCLYLQLTVEEKEKMDMFLTNFNNLVKKAQSGFITGIGRDVNSDEEWNAFQQEMETLGIAEHTQILQNAWERQK